MLRRVGVVATLTAAAAGGPYVASETEWGREATSTVTSLVSTNAGDSLLSTGIGDSSVANAHRELESLRPIDSDQYRYDQELVRKLGGMPSDESTTHTLVGTRVSDLREVLRFDITADWVTNRFSRVSTVLADLRLQGLRVPIVTGTNADDLAGTLTFYFDYSGKMQRVTIHGFTGHPGQVIDTMTKYYGLAPEPNLEAGVYTSRWNGVPVHFLRLTHAPVVYADAVHQKYTVFLELNQPDLAYGISEEALQIVSTDRQSGRW